MGQFCGQCYQSYSHPAYSYSLYCVKCPVGTDNWGKYLAVSLLPLTAFFLAVLVLRFRATSPQLNGYILICQLITSPLVLRQLDERHFWNALPASSKHLVDTYISFMSIWNLDFFKEFYTPFCLHPHTSMLQILSLDYLTAVYPLVLIAIVYIVVTLHYRHCPLVVWLWRPFWRCFARLQRQWDIHNTLLDAFATFFLLSYVKFLTVSFDILLPSFSWDIQEKRQPTVLFYDGTIEYFSEEHFPYAILAIAVLCLFTIFPIVFLCLYPCACFQKFLNKLHLNRHTLQMLMDIFQGCFKNGTGGTKDCQYFASIYLMIRLALYPALSFSDIAIAHAAQIITLLAFFVLLLSCFQPYKTSFSNKLDIFFLLCIILVISLSDNILLYNFKFKTQVLGMFRFVLLLVPLAYPICLGLYYFYMKSRRLQNVIQRIKLRCQGRHFVPSVIQQIKFFLLKCWKRSFGKYSSSTDAESSPALLLQDETN